MAIPVALALDGDQLSEGSEYRLTIVDERLMKKIDLIRALRNLTGAELRSSKRAIEMLQTHGSVIFNANLGWASLPPAAQSFEVLGVRLTREIEVDEYDTEGQSQKRLDELLEKIPNLPQRQDPTCEQLADLIVVAQRLGMYDAADALKLWLESVRKAERPATYYVPRG